MANYGELPASSNYKAYYRCEDTSDSSGNGNTLTNNNSVAFNPAFFAKSADFGSGNTSKSLSITNNLGITGGNVTISMWVKSYGDPSGCDAFFFQSDNTSKVQFRIYYCSGPNLLSFERNINAGSQDVAQYTYTVSTTSFDLLTMTYDGVNIRGYVNAVLKAGPSPSSGNGSGTINNNTYIAANTSGAENASIVVDEVIVEGRVWSADEIRRYFTQAKGRLVPYPSL